MSTVRERQRTRAYEATGAQAPPFQRTTASELVTPRWPGVVLLALCGLAILVGILELGPASGPSTRDRIVTAQKGVVQSTVSGSGTLQPVATTNVNFKTGGQLSHVYVSEGQSVHRGQLLAELDPASAQAALDEAAASLASANAKVDQARSETTSQSSTTTQQATTATAAASPQATAARSPPQGSTPSGSKQAGGSSGSQQTASRQTSTVSTSQGSGGQSSSGQGSSGLSAAQIAADVASAEAAVESATVTLNAARKTLAETKLVAPGAGIVTSLSGQVGDSVGAGGGSSSANNSSAGGGTASSGSSSSTTGTGSSAAGGGAAGGGNRTGTSGSTSSSSSTSGTSSASSAFIVISDLGHLQLQVPLSESDIHRVVVNQPASVTVNALPSEKLAAHVKAIDDLPTTSNGVVSYNVTLELDQSEAGLKSGMTASAQVVVSQIDGAVTVPSSAISRRGPASTVTVVRGGKKSTQPVVTGITGDSTIQIISGLNAGQQVAIAIPTGTSRGTTAGGLGGGGGFRGAFGGGGLGGGGGFGGGGIRRAGGGGGPG